MFLFVFFARRTEAIRGWFEDIGLKTSIQDWEMQHGSEKRNGSNIYGILHAPRGENTEAMVLVAPWLNQDGEYNDGGVALVVALARYLSKWSVWSKNVIFVVTSDSHLAMRSWVSAYHTSLGNTAGAIEAAIVLDYPSKNDHFESIEVLYEGLNGQLPNLDLVNSAILVSVHEGLRVVVQGMNNIGFQRYGERALTFFRGIMAQLSAGMGPGPGCDTFSGYRINAITLRALGSEGNADITTFGRIAESTLRSVNNLLEHFHQSFFFYFLLAPKNFVSIGTYLPAVLLVAIAYPLMAIYNIATAAMAEKSISGRHSVFIPFIVLSGSYGACFFLAFATIHLLSTQKVVWVIFAMLGSQALCSFQVLSALFGNNTFPKPLIRLPALALSLAQAYSMIFHGLILTTLGMLNFSLAFFVGLTTLPLTWVRPLEASASVRQAKWHYVRSVVLLAVSTPWAWLQIITWLSSQGSSLLSINISTVVDNLLWGWRGLDVWTWGVIVGVWLPYWVVNVSVAFLSQLPTSSTAKGLNKVKAQ